MFMFYALIPASDSAYILIQSMFFFRPSLLLSLISLRLAPFDLSSFRFPFRPLIILPSTRPLYFFPSLLCSRFYFRSLSTSFLSLFPTVRLSSIFQFLICSPLFSSVCPFPCLSVSVFVLCPHLSCTYSNWEFNASHSCIRTL